MWRVFVCTLLFSGCSDPGGGPSGETTQGADPTTTTTQAPPEDTTSMGAPGETSSSGTTSASEDSSTAAGETTEDSPPADGTMRVLSYNVAGLPDALSSSTPSVNIPLISPLLNDYELVLVQEDFSYHPELSEDAKHPHQSRPGGGGTFGDGLNRFSQSAFTDFQREGWDECNGIVDSGSDCLTEKGFTVGLHELAPGATVDVYNLHMDAGGSDEDIAARQAQVQQLLEAIVERSANRAVIVAGDTNMDEEDEADFVVLLEGAGLTDACRELACGEEFRIDRIMSRSSDRLELTPTSWLVDSTFVDDNGGALSDHEAVVVDFDWVKP